MNHHIIYLLMLQVEVYKLFIIKWWWQYSTLYTTHTGKNGEKHKQNYKQCKNYYKRQNV